VKQAVRCLVADDHPALTAAVTAYLGAHGFEVVGPAADGTRAVALARDEQPELALVDFRMPRLQGVELIAALRLNSPSTGICVYTADADDSTADDAIAAGAAGIVLKESPLGDVVSALRAVRAGDSYVDPRVAGRQSLRGKLTQRELDVLELLAEGLPHEEIGRRLGISSETVRTHLRKASNRLDASTRTQAVATALRLGLIT
jgi:DNA-binding NarL/FixJ family response regulator